MGFELSKGHKWKLYSRVYIWLLEALCRVWGSSSLKGMSESYIVVYIWLFEALCRAWGLSSLKGMSESYIVVYIWLSIVFSGSFFVMYIRPG